MRKIHFLLTLSSILIVSCGQNSNNSAVDSDVILPIDVAKILPTENEVISLNGPIASDKGVFWPSSLSTYVDMKLPETYTNYSERVPTSGMGTENPYLNYFSTSLKNWGKIGGDPRYCWGRLVTKNMVQNPKFLGEAAFFYTVQNENTENQIKEWVADPSPTYIPKVFEIYNELLFMFHDQIYLVFAEEKYAEDLFNEYITSIYTCATETSTDIYEDGGIQTFPGREWQDAGEHFRYDEQNDYFINNYEEPANAFFGEVVFRVKNVIGFHLWGNVRDEKNNTALRQEKIFNFTQESINKLRNIAGENVKLNNLKDTPPYDPINIELIEAKSFWED